MRSWEGTSGRLVNSPIACNSWDFTDPKLGDRNSIQVTHMGDKNSVTWAVTSACQVPHELEAEQDWGIQPS